MAIAMTLKEYLDDRGVEYDLLEHPYSVCSMRTAFEAHVSGEDIAKAVVLHDDEGYMMAVIPATHKVLLGQVSKHYGRYLALADEAELQDMFSDCSLGAIPPIGKAYGMKVIYDEQLNNCNDVYFEAGDHTDLIHVSGRDFRLLMQDVDHGKFSRHI